MNRPTIDTEELLEMADEACAAGDYTQAVAILRKATAEAPLRKDIRNRLALALEGTPIPRKRKAAGKSKSTASEFTSGFDFSEDYSDSGFDDSLEPDSGGRDAIGAIAKKAFDAAAGKTARAGVATRNLTNLLQQGIQTWKSSLADNSARTQPRASAIEQNAALEASVSPAEYSDVFKPETELNEYLNRAESASTRTYTRPAPFVTEDEEAQEVSRISTPANTSKKAASAKSPGAKTAKKRGTDVEDVLAAGIDGFIEAVGRANRKKIAYGITYVFLVGVFAYACFDVSRKFPAVEAIPGGQVAAASVGGLNLNVSSDVAIAQARQMATAGKIMPAIDMLRSQLESKTVLQNRDKIRVELASLLNQQAGAYLTNNKIAESVATYRDALKVLPGDGGLQLRLCNALYYQGTLSEKDGVVSKAALSDAERILKTLVDKNTADLQAHRLLALIQTARGEKSLAQASWKKVKSLAPAGSPELSEAAAHLK